MTAPHRKRPVAYIILIVLVAFLAINAIPAGVAFVLEPSGATLGLTTDVLQNGPFDDYLVPGLFLFLVLGVWSLIIVYGLWKRPAWQWAAPLVAWTGRHWSLVASLLQGLILMAWIGIQIAIIGYDSSSILQPIVFANGLAISSLCLLPSVRRYCAEP